jgi:class 3 adenylate cyclase/tetratricopeptide (TPR) repeat protein
VLFSDLVGSTALAAGMDPEDWRAAVAAYHRAAAHAVTRYGGHVAKFLGDGVMAFFGYPEAHDDDAERAVRAGLAILEAIAKLNESAARPQLAARVGIDSGAVVVGAGAGPDADVFGDAPNIAARVQATAEPGTVLVSANTHRLISGLFLVDDRGAQSLKGISEPLRLYRIVRPSGVRGRFEAAAESRGLTPFVGREDELRSLMNRWQRVLDGEGQMALIIGEAGIGKSRLVHRFRETLGGTPHAWIEAAAGPFYQNTPFYPVTEMLRQMVWAQSFNRLDDYLRELQAGASQPAEHQPAATDEPADERFAQLLSGLALAGLNSGEAVPLIAPLLNLPLPAGFAPSTLLPDQQRRRLLATLAEWVLASAKAHPLVLSIEDLHWVDPSTLELIQLLVEQGAHAPLLLLYTARPEFHPPWPLRAHHAQITLNRLSARDIRAMVAQVAAQKALADETISAVVERTGGVPLFIEELTRSLLESGDVKPSGRAIPATLHDSLMARIDRLGAARETLQAGAVLGGEFSYELLHAIHELDESELQRRLRILTDAELLYVRGIAPEATYQFKHALIRDAAYEALLKSRRRELHRLVAETIDAKFPAIKEPHPEILSRHYTEAGLIEQAIPYWQRAGRNAIARSAYTEGISHLRAGLDLLRDVTSTPQRAQQELDLEIALATALMATKGWAAPEVAEAFGHAEELCRRMGEVPQLVPVLYGIWGFFAVRGELERARQIGTRLLALAETAQDSVFVIAGHYALGVTFYWIGDLEASEQHLAELMRHYTAPQHQAMTSLFGMDLGIVGTGYSAAARWLAGYPDLALERSDKAVQIARTVAHPESLAWALLGNSIVHHHRREERQAAIATEELFSVCRLNGLVMQPALGKLIHGWALAVEGDATRGCIEIREAFKAFSAPGLVLMEGQGHALLAEAYWFAGDAERGLLSLEESLTTTKSEERNFAAELCRIRGELLRLRDCNGPTDINKGAEGLFQQAITIARDQHAKSLELRTTTSLARLLRDTNRRDEARTMLVAIYDWFTEGFDTLDLKEAKALLDELNSKS